MAQIIETEETLIIETPERVQLAFALASIGNRFLAALIDHFIQILAMIFLSTLAGFILRGYGLTSLRDLDEVTPELAKWAYAILTIVVFLVFAAYFVFFEWLWNGQTPGKRLLKLRVIREDGRPITFWEVLTRNLVRIFDMFPGLYSIGLIAVFLSNRDQRIGDLFAGTVVVRERTDEAPTFAETFSNPTSDDAFRRVQPKTGIRDRSDREFFAPALGSQRPAKNLDGLAHRPASDVQDQTRLRFSHLYLRRLFRGNPPSISCPGPVFKLNQRPWIFDL